MIQTQIELTEARHKALEEEAHRQNSSLSEVVRAAWPPGPAPGSA
jgi:hypothetical protein